MRNVLEFNVITLARFSIFYNYKSKIPHSQLIVNSDWLSRQPSHDELDKTLDLLWFLVSIESRLRYIFFRPIKEERLKTLQQAAGNL